jgi:hypothetical protein
MHFEVEALRAAELVPVGLWKYLAQGSDSLDQGGRVLHG